MSDYESEDDEKKCIRGESSKKYTHKSQKFRSEWLKNKLFCGWLLPVNNNVLLAKCKLCICEMTAELSVIKRHALSKKHKSMVQSIGVKQTSISSFIDNTEKMKFTDQTKRAEILLCSFVSEHNLAFNTTDHLAKICKAAFPDSKICSNISLSRTKSSALVKNVLGKYAFEEQVKILKDTHFSVIIDESTDIGCIKTMCICVKYFEKSSNCFETKFFKLVQLFEDSESANKGATGQKIFDEVVKAFTDSDIPLSNIIGNFR